MHLHYSLFFICLKGFGVWFGENLFKEKVLPVELTLNNHLKIQWDTFKVPHCFCLSFLFQTEDEACEGFAIPRNERIEIPAAAVDGTVGGGEEYGDENTGSKAPDVEQCGQDEKQDTQVLEGVSEFIVGQQ